MNQIFQTGFFDSIFNSQRTAMKSFSAILTIVFLLSFLTACGSGGSGEAETSVDGATDTQVSSSQEQIQTGVFVDAAVSGVSYRTRTQQGITNEQGEFQYIEGEMVTFSIGGITLGTVYGAKVITPVQLTESESPADAAALNQLVFLQSLDLNSDSDDGIQISEQAHNLAENLKLDFDSRMFSEEAAILVAQLSGGANGLVSEEDALTHFYET